LRRTTLTLADHAERAGSASALLGTAQFIVGGESAAGEHHAEPRLDQHALAIALLNDRADHAAAAILSKQNAEHIEIEPPKRLFDRFGLGDGNEGAVLQCPGPKRADPAPVEGVSATLGPVARR